MTKNTLKKSSNILYKGFNKGFKGIQTFHNSYYKNLSQALCGILTLGVSVEHPMDLNFKQGVVVGLHNNKPVYYDTPLSTLIIAPPGSGKTAAVAIPNLLTLKSSVVVLDIKGELCDLTAGYRQQVLGNEIYIFNPLGDDNSLKFNPFDKRIVEKLNFDRKRRLAEEVSKTIFTSIDGKEGDSYWREQAGNLFAFYALYDLCVKQESFLFDLAFAPIQNFVPLIHPKSPYYRELYIHKVDQDGNFILDDNNEPMLERDSSGNPILNTQANPENLWYRQVSEQVYLDVNDPRNYDGTVNRLQRDKKGNIIVEEGMLDPIVRNEANKWANSNEKEFASIRNMYSKFTQVFTSYPIKEATSSMSFEYEDLRRKNISLYIKIAQTDIDILAPLIRVLLESIGKNLLLRESKKFNERVYFILDEFVRFGKLPFLLEMPALSRSYGVVIMFITQSNALIEKYYSKEDARIVNNTVAYRVVFKMNDLDYAKQLSEEIGKYTREKRNRSTEKNQVIFGGTSSYSEEGYELVSVQDIMNINKDEVIILVSGHYATPLKLKANYYFKNKRLLKCLNIPLKPNEEVFKGLRKVS
ncbi:type IV secretory system conjugative DNA transfer family protein [Helicobacter cetorum]|uniref:Cag island DNA transfer protein n=1 Tax=Helicobacter cetorum (strain ATCC BAA-429 / MIT 00-7128) TaxID=182217 RepID=I0EMF9_HELC0|nr:type IV secretory system conjugative DNA transfer family protein [Helicobacter cetorum]AFI04128.1 cag island DNA transfer protein [Helicobacter cetorum MIT 00-7128]